ncbi:MAG: putative peptide modification system cyclase [Xanthomonadales bacterium]|nr:putative peptide modification system cyclase [Xanthomonadales bacterium]
MTVSTSPASGVDIAANSLLRTLLLCDLVDSTALVERLGDREAAELIRKHDRLARTLADRHGGQEIDKTDGFMMMFERPIQAVAFALDYQRGLRQLNAAEKSTLAARVGIHVGDVVVWDNSSEDIAKGAKPVEVEGLVKPVTSRLMNLALPGQILLSNIAYDLAHRAQGELGEALEKVRWRTHGRYRFRGVPDPVAVFEVGEEGLAPLKAPPWSSKAHREVPFWRRPATVVIEALVVVALITVPLVMFLRPDPAIAFANRDWVVVGSLHNLTGETVFDDALESALRIGLEQSRYVNVLPDLKVRDTVTRMQRDPDSTEIDRAVGSEVAIRDGARALILPTIAEIGGRVRITAEVIDPQTQTTVYSETADGIGKESILPSLDTINERLRVRLGEALATVSNESMPLEKVTTANLDALKAYSLGIGSNMRGQFSEALALYQQALAIDPGLASATLKTGVIHASAGRSAEATEAFQKALAERDRLSPRDVLYAEVMLSTVERKSDALSRWAALAQTYPDFFAGTGGYAYVSWRDANRFDASVVAFAESSASLRNPSRLPALHLLGILHLGNNRFDEAFASFEQAEATGFVRTEIHAATFAAQRKHAQATQTLARSADTSITENPIVAASQVTLRSAIALDRGDGKEASRILMDAAGKAPADNIVGQAFVTSSDSLGLEARDLDRKARLERIESAIKQSEKALKDSSSANRDMVNNRLLVLAYLAAHLDARSLAGSALALVGQAGGPAYSINRKLQVIATAELDRDAGHAEQAITRIKAMLDGSEPYLAHVTLMNAYAAAGKSALALAEARWLSEHRGRAYAEHYPAQILTAYNIEQANLALLRGAELALDSKDKASARGMLGDFLKAWPDASRQPAWQKRIETLQRALAESQSP